MLCYVYVIGWVKVKLLEASHARQIILTSVDVSHHIVQYINEMQWGNGNIYKDVLHDYKN